MCLDLPNVLQLSYPLNMLLVFSELYKMVCDPDETDLDIHIPAVMLPQDAGTSLEKMLISNSSGMLYVQNTNFTRN